MEGRAAVKKEEVKDLKIRRDPANLKVAKRKEETKRTRRIIYSNLESILQMSSRMRNSKKKSTSSLTRLTTNSMLIRLSGSSSGRTSLVTNLTTMTWSKRSTIAK